MAQQRIAIGGLLFVAACASLAPRAAWADNPKLVQARSLYEALRYDEAYGAFREALNTTGNRPDEIADIYMHLGILAASMGQKEEAETHFKHLICLQPEVKLSEALPPKVRRPFDSAKGSASEINPFRLIHTTLSELPAEGGLDLQAELLPDSLNMAVGLTLQYRVAGGPSFASLRKDGTGVLVFSVSATELPAGEDVEYFLQINDAHGGVLWEFGSAVSPIVVQGSSGGGPLAGGAVDDDEGGAGAWYQQGWVWVVIGASAAVLVAGGTTAAIVATMASTPSTVEFGAVEHEVAGGG
jgi:tetratricopeptide (TPR) repeat protein